MENNNLFSIDLLNFIRYKPEVSCDKRVLFEALLIKYKSFGMRPFYYSRARIQAELGIKRDRSTAIIKEFKELGFLHIDLLRTIEDGKPRQANYFRIIPIMLPQAVEALMNDSTVFMQRISTLLTNNR